MAGIEGEKGHERIRFLQTSEDADKAQVSRAGIGHDHLYSDWSNYAFHGIIVSWIAQFDTFRPTCIGDYLWISVPCRTLTRRRRWTVSAYLHLD